MAERIVAPGVYTKEIDQSFLPGAIAQIGAAIVGPTTKGPALVPTQITSFGDFTKIFGSYSDESYVPYAVNEYLKNGGNVITVTRLLYEDGYNYSSNGVLAVIATSGSSSKVTHVLHPTNQIKLDAAAQAASLFGTTTSGSGVSGSFSIVIDGAYNANKVTGAVFTAYPAAASASASINPSANDYVTKIYGTSPKSTDYPVYVQYEDKNAYASFANPANITCSIAKFATYPYVSDYSTAETPWITSQLVGSVTKDLFKFHTLSHGTSVNHEVKVGIKEIKTSTEVTDPDGYPTFVVEVRRVNTTNIPNSPYISSDTDKNPDLVEEFLVNLNPDSPRYIENVIGNRFSTINGDGDLIITGDYPNRSQYVRVEVETAVSSKSNSKLLIPFGFRSLTSPIIHPSASVNIAAASYITSQTATGTFSKNTFHGFDFTNSTNLNYLAPTPSSASTTGSNTDFYLGNVTQRPELGFPASSSYSGSLTTALTVSEDNFKVQVALSTRKFIVPFQGGFDGAAPNLPKNSGLNITDTNTFGFNCATATSTGTVAYNKAFALLGNTDYYDINLLLTPGIIQELHPSVTLAARTLAEERQDTFYVMDIASATKNVTFVADQAAAIDSNYTACYWPWVRVTNPVKNTRLWVPPSVVMPGVLAFNDANAAPWYAPAGLTRGGLTSVSDTYFNLSQTQRGTLYEARVNPIANFPQTGIAVWGQKTLQARQSALDRVNVRRLLIAVKKYIASATRFLVFEQNTDQTRKRFTDIVNPYLSAVASNQGLYAFKVIMDGTNNTNDLVDQNILYGQLFLQPTRTAEFILLDFNIQPTGAAFPE